MAQTNKTHTAITFARASLHLDLCPVTGVQQSQHAAERLWWCSRIPFLGAAFILIQFSFAGALCSLSLSQESHSVKLTRQGITGCYNTATYKLTYVFASSNL